MSREPDYGVAHWISQLKPEHQAIAQAVHQLILEIEPRIVCTTKWHKPTQPAGIPFYGTESQGWIMAMWSFKAQFGIGFFAGTLLEPTPQIDKIAGPWNKNPTMKARRYDVQSLEELDTTRLKNWISQALQLPGWGKITG